MHPAVRLGMTQRMPTGGSYKDQMMLWDLGRSMTFQLFNEMFNTITLVLRMPGIPLGDSRKLKKLAHGLEKSRINIKPLCRCVGELDGVAISIKNPPYEYVPRNFYCRKGMCAFPVQAVVERQLKFMYMSCGCAGSKFD